MTTETQTFIQPSDLRAVRIECSKCHIKSIFSLADEESRKRVRVTFSNFQCPHCKETWFTHQDGSYVDKVVKFFEGLEALKGRGSNEVIVSFEISPMPSVSQKSEQAR
jgi:hypothetical protein